MRSVQFIDTVLSFALALIMLLGYFAIGLAIELRPLLDWAVALGLPLYAAVRWWLFVAPQARHRLPQPWRILYELKLMLMSAAAMYIANWKLLATAFMLGIIIHISLTMVAIRQKPSGSAPAA